MRKLFLLFISFAFTISYAQINLDGTTTLSTVNTCAETLYDSGGPTGNYQSGEDYSITFCSTNGDCMEISFHAFAMETGYDYLYIYDGTSSTDPLLVTATGSNLPSNVTSSGTCITVAVHTDNYVTQAGFELSVNCTGNCYVPPPPPPNDGPCSAYTLTVNTACNTETHTTLGATDSGIPDPTCGFGYMGGDVWFEATVPASGFLVIETFAGSMPNGGIALYSGSDCNNLTEIVCEEPWTGGFPGQQLIMSSAGLAGQTVWIRIWDPNNDVQGTFDICAYEPPPILDVDTTAYTPQELVEDVLITGCLQAMNTQFWGPDSAIGYFTNGDIIGMQSGLVLACGKVTDVSGTDDADDSFLGYTTTQTAIATDLLAVANNNNLGLSISNVEDVVVLEFDFIPSSDTTEFDFVFASEEYQSYECTVWNDAFAFFVSGPGIAGPYTDNAINIAVVPGTTDPITISTINGVASCGPDNSQYYVNNTASPMMNVNGFTVPLTATMAGLTPCETYHIRFVIGDASDQILTSYVFFEEGSFTSGGDVIMNNFSNVGTTSDIYEGCDNYWVFNRVDTSATAMQDTIFIDLIENGTATPGVDYTTSNTNLVILPGEYTDTLFYSALWDNIAETNEYVVFTLLNGCPCTITSTDDTIWFMDNFELNPIITPSTTICMGDSVVLDVTINPLQDPSIVSYLWDDGSTGTSITVTPTGNESHWVNCSTPCQQDTTVYMDITVIPNPIPNFTVSKDTICIGEDITITYTGNTGVNPSYLWSFNGGNPSSATTVGPHTVNWSTAGGKTISLNIDDTGCLADSSIDIFVSPNPVITITPTNNLCFGDCAGELLAAPQDTMVPYTYSWNNGQTTNPATALCVGQYDVTAYNSIGCEATFSGQITEPVALSISTSSVDAGCYGGSDGEASATVQNGTAPYQYAWTGPSGFTAITANITGLISGWYTVGVLDANNCTIKDSVFVNQPDSPLTSNITGDNIDCFGSLTGNVYIEPTGGTTPYTFIWSNTATSQNLIGVAAGQYDVTLTDNNGCIGYNTITLTEPTQLVNNSITTTDVSCWGYNDGAASISVSGSVPPYVYNWSHGGGNQASFNDLYSANYIVTVTDANNCEIIVSGVDVGQPSKLHASIGIVPTICIGQSIDLIASVTGGTSPYQYFWNTSNISPTITVSPTDTTTYYLTVTDLHNCTTVEERDVNVYAPISMEMTTDVTEICPGDPIQVTITPHGGNGTYTFTSSMLGIVPSPHIIYPNGSITYTVTVSDNCGSPVDFESVDITMFEKPPLSFISDIIHGCQPLTVHFSEQSPDIGQTYVWDFGDGSSSNTSDGKNPEHIYENWGIFDVHLDVYSAEGCKNSFTFEKMIEVYKLPEAKFTANPVTASVIKPEISFFNYSVDNYLNYWWFGDGEMSYSTNPIHNYAEYESYYTVKLKVETEHGCVDSTFTNVKIENVITIYVPSAFSPDNDGINDTFFALGNGIDLDYFNMKIYNRWGEIIFETDDMTQAWDGKSKQRFVETGVYKWLITYKDERGIEFQKSGTVTVIR